MLFVEHILNTDMGATEELREDEIVKVLKTSQKNNGGGGEEHNLKGLYYNHDAEKRAKNDEAFQSRILREYARIINIPNEARKEYDKLITDFLKWIRYNDAVSDSPLTWPLSCGQNDKTFAIRVKMTYQFWNWFRAEGAKNLSDYNKANGTEMRLLQEKGLRNKEKENLCLFVRNKIKEMYKKEGKKPIVMRLKKEQLILGELGAYDPVILAKRLDLDMSEWKGMSMEYLMDERVLKEGKALAIGPINLPGLAEEENHEDAPKSRKRQMEEDTAKPFKTKKISD